MSGNKVLHFARLDLTGNIILWWKSLPWTKTLFSWSIKYGWPLWFAQLSGAEKRCFFAPVKSCASLVRFSSFMNLPELNSSKWSLTTLSCWSIIEAKNLIEASFNTKKYGLSIVYHQKISLKHCLTPKKSHLSIVYYQEIYEIWWTLAGYHLKSKNSLKRDGMRNTIYTSMKPISAEFKNRGRVLNFIIGYVH